jgi:hypothetical protein
VLWLAVSLQYADVTEDGLIGSAISLGMGTFGALGLQDLRSMPVMTYVRTMQRYRKMVEDAKNVRE